MDWDGVYILQRSNWLSKFLLRKWMDQTLLTLILLFPSTPTCTSLLAWMSPQMVFIGLNYFIFHTLLVIIKMFHNLFFNFSAFWFFFNEYTFLFEIKQHTKMFIPTVGKQSSAFWRYIGKIFLLSWYRFCLELFQYTLRWPAASFEWLSWATLEITISRLFSMIAS